MYYFNLLVRLNRLSAKKQVVQIILNHPIVLMPIDTGLIYSTSLSAATQAFSTA